MTDSPSDIDDYTNAAATFGDRISVARQAMGYSSSSLAKRLGVREATLLSWEEDRAEPRANKLQMLAGLLNVSIIWLMSGEGMGVRSDRTEIGREEFDEVLAELREIRTIQQTLATRTSRLERRLATMLG